VSKLAVPIRLRLAALFAAGTALLIGVGGTLFVGELSGGLTGTVTTEITTSAELVATSPADRRATLVTHLASSGPTQFALLERDGALLATSTNLPAGVVAAVRSLGRSPREALVPKSLSSGDILLYVRPIPRSQDVLIVGSSLAAIDETLDGVELSLIVGGPIGVLLAGVGRIDAPPGRGSLRAGAGPARGASDPR
jgi:hypothetical protein